MARPASGPSNDVTVYLVLNDYRTGLAFVETALEEADRETVIRNFLSGQYRDALRVVAFNAAEGWSRDVSEDVANEVLDRAFDADETLTEGTKHFIDRHVTRARSDRRRHRCGAGKMQPAGRHRPDRLIRPAP
jgi:hypothetical protein